MTNIDQPNGQQDREAAMNEVLDVWQRKVGLELTTAERTSFLANDAVRKLSGRLRRGGRHALERACARAYDSRAGTLDPDRWLSAYDRIHHPGSGPGPRRRGISEEDRGRW